MAEQNQRKRVLFVINSLVSGGAERVMCTLLAASEAERDAYEIELALLDREPPVYAPPSWTPTHQLDCRSSLARSIVGLRRLFTQRRPDIVISFLTRANIAAVIAARSLNIPCIISERVQNSAHLGDGLSAMAAKQLIRLAYPRAQRILAVSSGVATDLHRAFGVAKSKITVIENPVDVASIEQAARQPAAFNIGEPYIVGVGRLTTIKNFTLLIEALRGSRYAGKLVIVGDGPERARLEQSIAEQGLTGRVILAGHQENPFPIVAGADFFVSASNAEGFPNALIEAMALGVPVIAANCPSGPAEILADLEREQVHGLAEGAHGILTPMNDATLLSRAIDMLTDPTARAQWSDKAKARAREYSVARAKERYWAVLREIIDRPAQAAAAPSA